MLSTKWLCRFLKLYEINEKKDNGNIGDELITNDDDDVASDDDDDVVANDNDEDEKRK